ncbi:PepSY domain-containing protein [Sinanaerobacter chloroacetimidivorans]|uniref:PepSY domain-containing protein n=1 Tax=Sinanaerobacter chloroacetimidivorans TaxID=2818044 RepID=A0A8J8B3M7_9FIRM|nr:PepSY domain-containing protein [Sinanaerobacter chloroacetimidivorans]MBR0598480.1 PepSY domain-containing protein [Sinanaerobacter chloroacetimidivorans]
MNKKVITLVLVGVMALGGTVVAYATTNNAVSTAPNSSPQAVSEDQSKDQEDQNKESNDDQELTAANTKTAITEDQAKQTALASIKDGTVQSIQLEDEDGVVVYGVEIKSGNSTYDVKVDANTCSIVKSEQDNENGEKGKIEKESQDNDNVEHENDSEDPAGYED